MISRVESGWYPGRPYKKSNRCVPPREIATVSRPAARRSRCRSRGGDPRGGRGRQVAARLRVHPVAPGSGLARAGERCRVVRQGHESRPVIDLLKGYFKIDDRDGPREIRQQVTSALLTLDLTLEPTLPALLTLLDVPVDDAAWHAEPAERRQRMHDAVKRLFLRVAHERRVLLIIEDLHWIDAETQALLDGLVDSLASTAWRRHARCSS